VIYFVFCFVKVIVLQVAIEILSTVRSEHVPTCYPFEIEICFGYGGMLVSFGRYSPLVRPVASLEK